MEKTNSTLGEEFIKALGNKDLEKFIQLVDNEVYFLHPLVEMSGKEVVRKTGEEIMQLLNKVTIRDIFESGDKVMITHDVECNSPIGTIRTAVLLTFRNKLITRIELFCDPRPLLPLGDQFYKD